MTEETRKEEKIEKAQEQTEQIENPTELQARTSKSGRWQCSSLKGLATAASKVGQTPSSAAGPLASLLQVLEKTSNIG